MALNVAGPCCGHWFLECACIRFILACCCDALDAAELCEGVYPVVGEGLDELSSRRLDGPAARGVLAASRADFGERKGWWC
jgi:hypothetical protein